MVPSVYTLGLRIPCCKRVEGRCRGDGATSEVAGAVVVEDPGWIGVVAASDPTTLGYGEDGVDDPGACVGPVPR